MAQDNDATATLGELDVETGDDPSEQFVMVARATRQASPGEEMTTVFSAFGTAFRLEISKVAHGRVFVVIEETEGGRALLAEDTEIGENKMADKLSDHIGLALKRYLVVGGRINDLLQGKAT